MRISTITNWAYGVTVALTFLSGSAFIMAVRSVDHERDAAETAWKLDEIVAELQRAAEQTTEEARLYVIKGEERYRKAFQAADTEERGRGLAVKRLIQTDLTEQERSALRTIEVDAETLNVIEEKAVEDYAAGNAAAAREAVFSNEHEEAQAELLASVAHFIDLVDTRARDGLNLARDRADLWSAIAKSLLGLTALLFLSVLYFVLKRRVAKPLLQMSGVVQRLAKQDYTVELLADSRRDEIGELNQAIQIFRENGLERDRLDAERRKDQQMKDLILQLMHRLQACSDVAELAPIVALFVQQIFPNLNGHLFVMNEGRTTLCSSSSWGQPARSVMEFPSIQCWGVRRGRPHMSDVHYGDVDCQHLVDGSSEGCLCVPLIAHGDTVGVLYFEADDGGQLMEARVYIELIAENLGLAIANLQLRDRLTNLSVRDALTGLLNRRSLDESLRRLRRDTADLPAVLMMIDIDHFKRFNDNHGHDAGDHVMTQVASLMAEVVDGAGDVFRYGGEEFSIIMRNMDEITAMARAEDVRRIVEKSSFTYLGRPMERVTVSIGLASTEGDGVIATLMHRADAALLRAKSTGRNVVISDWSADAASKQKTG